MSRSQWVLLAYRLPREPSTPRITLWRKLKRLGAAQIVDGLVGLPNDSRNREQFDWLAEGILEAGGEASIWTAEAATDSQQRAIEDEMTSSVDEEYRSLLKQVADLKEAGAPYPVRSIRRIRRQLREIQSRDYFRCSEAAVASAAVEELGSAEKVTE